MTHGLQSLVTTRCLHLLQKRLGYYCSPGRLGTRYRRFIWWCVLAVMLGLGLLLYATRNRAGTEQPRVLVLMGAPGVGKGTYAKVLSTWLGLPHLSTGDLVRAAVRESDAQGANSVAAPLASKIRKTLQAGQLIDDELMVTLLRDHLTHHESQYRKGLILDGFPRRLSQVAACNALLSPTAVLHLVMDRQLLIRKITNRRICARCGHTYNIAHIEEPEAGIHMPALLPHTPGVCDSCGAPLTLVQRADDSEDTVKQRLQVYEAVTVPVVNAFRTQAKEGRLRFLELSITTGVDDMKPTLRRLLSDELLWFSPQLKQEGTEQQKDSASWSDSAQRLVRLFRTRLAHEGEQETEPSQIQ